MTKSRNMISKRKAWSATEDSLLRALYPCTTAATLASLFKCKKGQVYNRANKMGLSKSQWFKDSPLSSRLLREDNPGKVHRFKKGHVPANKGVKGVWAKGCEKTWFKKGQPAANAKPLYHERTNVYGYIEIKVPERNPHTGAPTRYVQKQHWVWKKANGPMPAKHIIHFIDGDKTNCDLDNLELIPQALNLRLNKMNYANTPDELKPTVKALAKLQYQKGLAMNAAGKNNG